jgi:hypothetical protein
MTLTDLLQGVKAEYALNVFGAAEIAAVEAALLEKGGKTYIRCAVRNKEIQAKPEEVIRQLWLHRLHLIYGYPFQRMTVEYPVTFGRDTSKRADIVVYDADRPTVPYLLVEVKQDQSQRRQGAIAILCPRHRRTAGAVEQRHAGVDLAPQEPQLLCGDSRPARRQPDDRGDC